MFWQMERLQCEVNRLRADLVGWQQPPATRSCSKWERSSVW
jgi:hypothetical protein